MWPRGPAGHSEILSDWFYPDYRGRDTWVCIYAPNDDAAPWLPQPPWGRAWAAETEPMSAPLAITTNLLLVIT